MAISRAAEEEATATNKVEEEEATAANKVEVVVDMVRTVSQESRCASSFQPAYFFCPVAISYVLRRWRLRSR